MRVMPQHPDCIAGGGPAVSELAPRTAARARPAVTQGPAERPDRPSVRQPLVTRFGDMVDVRNRDAVRIGRFTDGASRIQAAPAVVRIWHAERCRELSTHEARAFAAQLMAAAALAESQNS